MIKILVFVTALFVSFVINASGETVCPSTLSCDYDSGVCDTPSGWTLADGGAHEDFSSQNPISLSKITGLKGTGLYSIGCFYDYGKYSGFSIYTSAKELIGDNWVFSGFGKRNAECLDITDPTSCAGTSQVTGAIDYKLHIQQTHEALPLTTPSSCNNSCKKKTIRAHGNSTRFYCLPKSESPSGWGWVTEGNPQAALPLCECHPVSTSDGYSISCS